MSSASQARSATIGRTVLGAVIAVLALGAAGCAAAALAERQALATSIPALLAFAAAHKNADTQVEAQVRVLRAQLGLPPPETS